MTKIELKLLEYRESIERIGVENEEAKHLNYRLNPRKRLTLTLWTLGVAMQSIMLRTLGVLRCALRIRRVSGSEWNRKQFSCASGVAALRTLDVTPQTLGALRSLA